MGRVKIPQVSLEKKQYISIRFNLES